MSKLAKPRAFGAGAVVRDVVNGLVGDAGETLSATTDAGLLATSIGGWSVMGHTVGWNLRALLRVVAPSMSWRILPDGTLWIGTESWTSATGTFDAIDQDPADGSYVLGVEAPFVVPGTNIASLGHVNRCIDVITAGRLRTHVYVDFPSEGTRGINAAITRQVTQALAGVDYYASYVCQVVSQSSDLATVDIQPQGARNQKLLGGLSSVPVRGVAGIKVQFVPGATVLLRWDGGNPASPYVADGLSGDTATKVQLSGTHPAPLFDTFYTDLVAWIGVLNTLLGTLVPVTGATGGPAYASAIALPTSFVIKMALPANYQSQIVSNG